MKTYIGERETKWLFFILISSRAYIGAINEFVGNMASNAYIGAAICSATAFLLFFFTNKANPLIRRDLFSMMDVCCSRSITVVIGAFLTVVSALNCSYRLRMFSDAVSEIILPNSPVIYVMIFFAAAMAAVPMFGLEPVTRYGLIIGSVIAALTILAAVFNIGGYEASNLYFFKLDFDGGFVKNGFSVYVFSDIFYLYVISDFFKSGGAVRRTGCRSVAMGGILISALTLLYCLCMPYPASEAFGYPFFRLASLAKSSVVFQRLDGIVYIIWFFLGFICTGSLMLFTLMMFSKTFRCSDFKGVLPAAVFSVFALAYLDLKLEFAVNALMLAAAFVLPAVIIPLYNLKTGRRKLDEK